MSKETVSMNVYQQAVEGRRQFREALRGERERNAALVDELAREKKEVADLSDKLREVEALLNEAVDMIEELENYGEDLGELRRCVDFRARVSKAIA